MVQIWTVGTSTRSMDGFLALLKKHRIELLVDIRRFPTSRFEHFKKENLKESLKEGNIGYIHLEELGGYRKGGYEKHTESLKFKRGIKKLMQLAGTKRTAIMCAELLFFRCHRRYVSDKLVELGVDVIHIIDEKRIYKHKKR